MLKNVGHLKWIGPHSESLWFPKDQFYDKEQCKLPSCSTDNTRRGVRILVLTNSEELLTGFWPVFLRNLLGQWKTGPEVTKSCSLDFLCQTFQLEWGRGFEVCVKVTCLEFIPNNIETIFHQKQFSCSIYLYCLFLKLCKHIQICM